MNTKMVMGTKDQTQDKNGWDFTPLLIASRVYERMGQDPNYQALVCIPAMKIKKFCQTIKELGVHKTANPNDPKSLKNEIKNGLSTSVGYSFLTPQEYQVLLDNCYVDILELDLEKGNSKYVVDKRNGTCFISPRAVNSAVKIISGNKNLKVRCKVKNEQVDGDTVKQVFDIEVESHLDENSKEMEEALRFAEELEGNMPYSEEEDSPFGYESDNLQDSEYQDDELEKEEVMAESYIEGEDTSFHNDMEDEEDTSFLDEVGENTSISNF